MLEVKGFRAYRFSEKVVGNLSHALTPPFDVIDAVQRKALAALGPHNMTHVILPEAQGELDRYESAAKIFDGWIEEGALAQDAEDSYYLLEQRFEDGEGAERVRRALLAAVKIPENEGETILGHERTFRRRVEDRLALTRAARMMPSPLLTMYSDPETELGAFLGQMDDQEPHCQAGTIDGVTQRLWRIADGEGVVTRFFSEKTLYIADGHHRFETARAYREEVRRDNPSPTPLPSDYVLLGLVAFEDPGLFVYPAHRILDLPEGFVFERFRSELEDYFEVRAVEGDLARHMSAPDAAATFGMAIRGEGCFALTLKDVDRREWLGDDHAAAWRDLDVSVLHRGIFEGILRLGEDAEFDYEPDEAKALALWERGEKDAVFLLKGVTPAQIRACADAHEFMPQKATYLFPKLPAGGAIYRLE